MIDTTQKIKHCICEYAYVDWEGRAPAFFCLTPFELIASKAVRSTAGKLSSESNISLSSSWNLSSWNSTHFSWSSPLGPVWTGLIYFSQDSPSCIRAPWWCSHGAFSLPVSAPQSFLLSLLSVSAHLASAPAHRHSSNRVMSRYEVTPLMIGAEQDNHLTFLHSLLLHSQVCLHFFLQFYNTVASSQMDFLRTISGADADISLHLL